APDRRASGAARRRRSYETGVLRSHTMNIIPLVLYVCAFVGYSLHFARRTPISARLATTMLAAATLAHTFIIGMRTMQVGQVPVPAGARPDEPARHRRRLGVPDDWARGRLRVCARGPRAGDVD